jgi:hypothetical protein
VLFPGVLIASRVCRSVGRCLARIGAVGMLMSAVMIWHRQLRHFVLLPSCVALVSGIMLMIMNLKLMG